MARNYVMVGDLVYIKRPSVSVPKGTVGLVTRIFPSVRYNIKSTVEVLPHGADKRIIYLEKDLKVYKHACQKPRKLNS